MADWLQLTGRFPRGFEEPHSVSSLRFARWLLRDHHPVAGVKLSNAPCFETWIFPHIPKTAGTAFVEALGESQNIANVIIESLDDQSPRERLELLRRVVRTRKVIVSGHIHLKHWSDVLRWSGRERIVTILRRPSDIHVSNVNFIMGRIAKVLEGSGLDRIVLEASIAQWRGRYAAGAYHDPTRGPRDAVAAWLAMLERPFELTKECANEIIASKPYYQIYRELIHAYLGCGDESVAATVRFLSRLNPIIVAVDDIGAFAEEFFGVTVRKGVNARHVNVLKEEDIDPDILRRLVGRDSDLYDILIKSAWRPD